MTRDGVEPPPLSPAPRLERDLEDEALLGRFAAGGAAGIGVEPPSPSSSSLGANVTLRLLPLLRDRDVDESDDGSVGYLHRRFVLHLPPESG